MNIGRIAALSLVVLATAASTAPRKRRATLAMRESRSATQQIVTTLDTSDLFDLATDEIAISMNGMTKVFSRDARSDDSVGRIPDQPSWNGSTESNPPPRA